jgi:hypothetical protein
LRANTLRQVARSTSAPDVVVEPRHRREHALGGGLAQLLDDRPSARKTTRSVQLAAPGSWVTMTTVWPWLSTTRRRKPSTSAPDVESRLPVGSSAKTTSGRPTRPGARDPLLLAAGQLARPVPEPVAQADGVDHLVEPRRVGRRPAIADGSTMFSSAVRVGTRLKAWKTNPIRSRRSSVRWRSLSVVRSTSPRNTGRGGVVEPGGAVHERRLPGAGLAHDRGELTRVQVERHVVERDDPVSPDP